MPRSLCRAFAHSREYAILENQYRNGESQRSRQVETSRKRWQLAKRLTPAALAALRSFYDARGGPHEPFYFYDVFETFPKFSYDETGVSNEGRYTVRFEGNWEQAVGIARSDVPSVALVEIL